MSLFAGLRMEGFPARNLWECAVDVVAPSKKKGNLNDPLPVFIPLIMCQKCAFLCTKLGTNT